PVATATHAFIPLEALQEGDGTRAFVFVPGNGKVERRGVTIAFVDGGRVAISEGLDGVTAVVTDGADRLSAGTPVQVATAEGRPFSTTNVAILQLALVAPDVPYRTLERLADELTRRLERVPGVKESKGWAYPESELRVALDLPRLARLGVPAGQVLGALKGG